MRIKDVQNQGGLRVERNFTYGLFRDIFGLSFSFFREQAEPLSCKLTYFEFSFILLCFGLKYTKETYQELELLNE